MSNLSKSFYKILIIEDEEDFSWAIANNLSKHSDKIEIITSGTDDEALKLLKSISIDLVLIGIRNLQGLDESGLLSKIVKEYPHIKIIVMSFSIHSIIEKNLKEKGYYGYIEKSSSIKEFREIILKALKL